MATLYPAGPQVGYGFLGVELDDNPRPVAGQPDPQTRRFDPNPCPTLGVGGSGTIFGGQEAEDSLIRQY
jgi:hypothetical protein